MCFNKIYVQIIHLVFIRFHFLLISFTRVFFLTKEKHSYFHGSADGAKQVIEQ